MQDIGIAFGCAAAAAVLLGTLVDGNTASGAFGAVFAAVIAVRERAHKREERKREEELRRRMEEPLGEAGQGDATQTSFRSGPRTGDVSESGGQGETGAPSSRSSSTGEEGTSGADQADIPETQEPAERRAVRLELELLHEHAELPLADWRRVAIGTAGSLLLVFALLIVFLVTFFIVAFGDLPWFLPVLPALLAVGVLLAAGYWVGRTSRARGLLGPVVMGSIVGVSLPLAVLIVGDELEDATGFALYALAFTGAGILIASLGGWLGARRRARG